MTESDSQSKDETAEVLGRDESKKSPGSKLESVSRSASYSPSPPRSLPPPSPPSRQSSTSLSPQHFRTSRSRSPVSGRNGESSNRSERRENGEEVRSIEVSGLTKMVRESHLEYIFSQYGTITNIILPTFRMCKWQRFSL
jgi:RNA recognition motif-containing protein